MLLLCCYCLDYFYFPYSFAISRIQKPRAPSTRQSRQWTVVFKRRYTWLSHWHLHVREVNCVGRMHNRTHHEDKRQGKHWSVPHSPRNRRSTNAEQSIRESFVVHKYMTSLLTHLKTMREVRDCLMRVWSLVWNRKLMGHWTRPECVWHEWLEVI